MCMPVLSGSRKIQCFQGKNISVNNFAEHPNDNLVHVTLLLYQKTLHIECIGLLPLGTVLKFWILGVHELN